MARRDESRLGIPESKHDPQEDDPKLGPIIKEACIEANQQVCGGKPLQLGQCHEIWARAKQILKEKGIDWKSPADMNPNRFYD